ncbi:hypothetical protein HGB07_04575 [Candidatus Roizmanbacteria bacterium]|nr:hypothetical protein [Candidatus Roizmanbacteria bacterium]
MSFIDIFRPKWKNSNVFLRLAAVEKLTNQSQLAEVAKNDYENTIRIAAVNRLTDQTRLAEVALTNDNKEARYAALENLTDPNLRAKVLETFDYNEKDMETFRTMALVFNFEKE